LINAEPERTGRLQSLAARRKWFSLTAVNLGTFVTPFDTGIMSLILPTISISLNAPFQLAIWIPLTSLLVTAAFMPIFGRFSDAHGRKRYFIVGLVLFSVGAYVSGQSQTIYELLIYRIIQSLGGAFILANGRALIADAFPPHQRGFALGTHVSIIYVGMAVGTAITGAIVTVTAVTGWRYVFDVSSAIAAIAIPISLVAIHESPKDPKIKTDLLGSMFFIGSLGSALIALTAGANGVTSINAYIQYIRIPFLDFYVYLNTAYSLSLYTVVLVGAVCAVLFVAREMTAKQPLIDFHLFRTNSMFFSTNFAALFLYMSSYATLILLSFYLELILRLTPLTAGLLITLEPVSVAIFSLFGGWLADRTGSRDQAIAGLAIVAVALLLLSTISEVSTTYFLGFLFAMLGAGVGLFAPSNTNANLASVPPKDRAMSNGILGMMRFTGQSLSLTIGTVLLGLYLFGGTSSLGGGASAAKYTGAVDLFFLVDAALAGVAIVFAFRGREPAQQKRETA